MLFKKKNHINICYLDSSNIGMVMEKAVKELNKEYNNRFTLHTVPIFTMEAGGTGKEQGLKWMEEADLNLIDIRGDHPLLDDIIPATRKGKAVSAALLGGSLRYMMVTKMGLYDGYKFFNSKMFKKMSAKGGGMVIDGETDFDEFDAYLKEQMPGFVYKDVGAWFDVTRYWQIAGLKNVKQMIIMLSREYCGAKFLPKAEPPYLPPSPCLMHPFEDRKYDSLEKYLKDHPLNPEKPTVVTLAYDGMHFENNLIPHKAWVKELEPDVNIVPILCDGMKNINALKKMGYKDGKFIGDAFVSFPFFRLNGGPLGGREEKTYELIHNMDVPFYHPVPNYIKPESYYKDNPTGATPFDYLSNIVLPELDGGIEPILASYTAEEEQEKIACTEILPHKEGAKFSAARIKRMLKLQKMENKDKKLAIICYNYPPGEHNLANAAYLDTFLSIKNILLRLKEEGYSVGDIPENLAEMFLEKNIVNSPEFKNNHTGALIDKDEYNKLLLPYPKLKKDIEKEWGPFPGKVNVYDGKLRVPYLKFGNITVTIQPSRGVHENDDTNYHDKNLPPHHQYAAFYRFLNNENHALLHVGTHGTLEFLRGREVLISKNCDMAMLISDIPHFYIYQIGNPSEAMTAKRRSMATTIGYSTPVPECSELYGEYLKIEELFDELQKAEKMNPARVPLIKKEIVEKALENGWEDLEGDLVRIKGRIVEYKRSIIPVGLHTFGETLTKRDISNLLTGVMRRDHGDIKAINRSLAEKDGLSYDDLLENESQKLLDYDKAAFQIVEKIVNGEETEIEWLKEREYIESILSNCNHDFEMDSLVHALNGRHVKAGLAADVLKNPEVLPAGRNLFQFDPLSLPTDSAVKRGSLIAKNTIKEYFEKNGSYPKTTAVVLWGFETAKTSGETVGQVMEYLGVNVKTVPGDWYPEIEIIPSEEMDHPRINVMVNICGFFRDMFPNLVALIDDAIKMVSSLNEPGNEVRNRSETIRKQLVSEGVDERTAEELSTIRIFGPKASEYGTALTTMIERADWEEESELGNQYEKDMCFAYGRNINALESGKVNSILLSSVDMVSQVQDTYEYEVTDLDHYYEFFGGLTKAVENERGEKPEMYATNTATEKIKTESFEKAVKRGVTSRTFNPKWIDGMLEHDYHGAEKIADRIMYQVGLSATTDSVDQWTWQKSADTFIFDEEMRNRLLNNNKYATREIGKRLYEAANRGYWDISEEDLEKLREILRDFEELLEE